VIRHITYVYLYCTRHLGQSQDTSEYDVLRDTSIRGEIQIWFRCNTNMMFRGTPRNVTGHLGQWQDILEYDVPRDASVRGGIQIWFRCNTNRIQVQYKYDLGAIQIWFRCNTNIRGGIQITEVEYPHTCDLGAIQIWFIFVCVDIPPQISVFHLAYLYCTWIINVI